MDIQTETEVNNTVEVEKKLSHHDAQLIIQDAVQAKFFDELFPNLETALKHYQGCEDCKRIGLEKITGYKISCKQALLTWAKSGNIIPNITLGDMIASEHILGIYPLDKNSEVNACIASCRSFNRYWEMQTEGPKEMISRISRIIEVFKNERWDMVDIYTIGVRRIKKILDDLESGTITVSPNIYTKTGQLKQEIVEYVTTLQGLTLSVDL